MHLASDEYADTYCLMIVKDDKAWETDHFTNNSTYDEYLTRSSK